MFREMCRGKIHNAIITQTELTYPGSITIDENLMEAADILPHEKVQVVNMNNGERLETYVIKGKRGSRCICLNGPAARLGYVGDEIVIISYGIFPEEQCRKLKPVLVFVDEKNRIKKIKGGKKHK